MKALLFLGLLVFGAACSKPGPTSEELRKDVLYNLLSDAKNYKVTKFEVDKRMELKPDLTDQLDVLKLRYVVTVSAEVVNECRYNITTPSQLIAASAGILGGGGTKMNQEIHICMSDADVEAKVAELKETLKAKLGKPDYSHCTNPMFCNGNIIDEAFINKRAEAFKNQTIAKMADWKVLKAGEKIDIVPQYVVVKGNKEKKNWYLVAMGTDKSE